MKADTMVSQMRTLTANMAKSMTAIGTGISKLWALSGFNLAGTVFERAAKATSNISAGRIALMKGCAILALVSDHVPTFASPFPLSPPDSRTRIYTTTQTAIYTFAAANAFTQWNTLSTTG